MQSQLQELTQACREAFPGLDNHEKGARRILADIRQGRSWRIVRNDGKLFDLANREHVRELAAALPALTTRTQAEHARAAARLAADLEQA